MLGSDIKFGKHCYTLIDRKNDGFIIHQSFRCNNECIPHTMMAMMLCLYKNILPFLDYGEVFVYAKLYAVKLLAMIVVLSCF